MPQGKFTREIKRHVFIPVGPSIAYVPLTQSQFALIDAGDAELVRKYNGLAGNHNAEHTFYAQRAGYNRRTIWLHRFLLGDPPNPERPWVDHINRRPLDCRRSNLRWVSPSENTMNYVWRGRTSKTGITGVYVGAKGRYLAQIRVNGRLVHLGSFPDTASAHAACVNGRILYGLLIRPKD